MLLNISPLCVLFWNIVVYYGHPYRIFSKIKSMFQNALHAVMQTLVTYRIKTFIYVKSLISLKAKCLRYKLIFPYKMIIGISILFIFM